MNEMEVALELLRILLPVKNSALKQESREDILALYRKCLETVRSKPDAGA